MGGEGPQYHQVKKELRELREEQEKLKQRFEDFTAVFAWYWRDDRHKDLAYIFALKEGGRADLLYLSPQCGGRTGLIYNKPMVSANPEAPKTGHWEPMAYPDMEKVATLFAKAAEKAANAPESALTARP